MTGLKTKMLLCVTATMLLVGQGQQLGNEHGAYIEAERERYEAEQVYERLTEPLPEDEIALGYAWSPEEYATYHQFDEETRIYTGNFGGKVNAKAIAEKLEKELAELDEPAIIGGGYESETSMHASLAMAGLRLDEAWKRDGLRDEIGGEIYEDSLRKARDIVEAKYAEHVGKETAAQWRQSYGKTMAGLGEQISGGEAVGSPTSPNAGTGQAKGKGQGIG